MLLRVSAALALLATGPCAPSPETGTGTGSGGTPGGGTTTEPEPLTDAEIDCQVVAELGCGDSYTVDTSDYVNNITDYGPWVGNWSGPEVGFRLNATGDVTVRITAPGASVTNFDLFLMERNEGTCEASDTIDYHWNTLVIEGASGPYTVYVDGVSGVSGEVTVEVECGEDSGSGGGGTGSGGGGTGSGGGGTGSGGDDGTGTGTTPGAGGGTPTGSSVCYPGVANLWTTCVPTVAASSVSHSDYNYGSPSSSPSAAWYQVPSRYANLSAVSGSTPISPSFLVADFMASYKGPYGVFDPQVVVKMQQIRDAVGAITVNSGYRSPGYNSRQPGAASWSRHMYGDAVDFRAASASLSTLRSQCNSRGASFTKLYANHIHCDWRSMALPTGYYGGSARDEETEFTQLDFDEGEDAWFLSPPSRVARGSEVFLALDWEGFPEGDPYVQWQVVAPWGEVVLEGEGTELDFAPRSPGLWTVQAEVGGMLELSQPIQVD